MDELTRRGSRIRKLRKARRLTQEELCARSGVSVDTLSAMERGREEAGNPRLDTLTGLAIGLNMSVGQLMTELDDPDDTPRRRLEREIQDLCRQLDDKALELVRGQVGCVVAFRS